MNQAEKATEELRTIDALASIDSPYHAIDPLCRLIVTMLYIVVTVSYDKYDFNGLFIMLLFPVFAYQMSYIPVSTCFRKLKIVLPLVCAVGIFNPFFDTKPLLYIGSLAVSGGVVSMLTLMLKGIYCLMASFLLVATSGVEQICWALRRLHLPKMLTSMLLLTFRYVSVLLEELSIMTDAYHLRAPRQKGIEFKAWGSFAGQLLLRTMDRASALYESMELRGYNGEFYYTEKRSFSGFSVPFLIITCALILSVRYLHPAALLGALFT